MIGISTLIFDLNGALLLDTKDRAAEADNRGGSRRVTRTATLDGGAAVTDMGYSDADREIRIVMEAAGEDVIEAVRYIIEAYALVMVAMRDGAYKCAPKSYALNNGTLTIILLVTEKASE